MQTFMVVSVVFLLLWFAPFYLVVKHKLHKKK
jgi:hypothetical protein